MSSAREPFASRWSELRGGAGLLLRALHMLRTRRELWTLAALPSALTALALLGATAVVVAYAGELSTWLDALLPRLEAGPWYSWLWIGPARVLLAIVHALLFAAASLAALVVALLAASLLASPVLDALSERVERCAAGAGGAADGGLRRLLADAGSSLVNEGRRLAFFGGLWLAIWLAALIVPGGALLAPPVLVAVTVLFLPLEYAAFALDRRRLSFAERRAWLAEHRARALGFGLAAFGLGLVPGLNVLLLPALVTAGTLLVLERPPRGAAGRAPGIR